MEIQEFFSELEKKRAVIKEKPPIIKLERRDVLSESCLGLCVE
jgi:hypothetical protein